MKLEFTVKQSSRHRHHTTSIDLIGYYGVEQVIQDFEKVIEFHTLRYEDFKRKYILQHGQEAWDNYVESEK